MNRLISKSENRVICIDKHIDRCHKALRTSGEGVHLHHFRGDQSAYILPSAIIDEGAIVKNTFS